MGRSLYSEIYQTKGVLTFRTETVLVRLGKIHEGTVGNEHKIRSRGLRWWS